MVAVVAFVMGVLLVVGTLASAVRTMVVPRGVPTAIARWVFVAMRYVFRAAGGRAPDYERTDRVMAFYAPLSLTALPAVWLTIVLWGYTFMYWALGSSCARPSASAPRRWSPWASRGPTTCLGWC